MAIDPERGDVVLFGLRVGASFGRQSLLSTEQVSRFSANDMRTGWIHYWFRNCDIGGQSFAGRLSFHGEELESYSLQLEDARFGTSYEDAPPDGESERRAAHDAWLASFLGPAHEVDDAHFSKTYRFAWGSIDSNWDPRADSSEISVRFAARKDS